MNKKTIKYLIIFGVIILIVGGSFLAWQRGWILQKLSVFDENADWKTYKDVNGLVFDYPSDYFVQKEEKMLGGEEFWISSDKEGKKIMIMLKSFPNPFSPSTFDLGEGPESYYFSLPGKFDGGTSPVYTHINDDCAYNKKNCDEINEHMKLLSQKRYEIVNNKNQKVKVVRYISSYIWNTGSEMGSGSANNRGLEINFYERYVLDFGFKTVWVRLWEPLVASQIISEDKADEYIDKAVKKINSDKNLEKKLSADDEFIKRISIIDETADWKTYRNEEHRFEFKYPKDWTTGYIYKDDVLGRWSIKIISQKWQGFLEDVKAGKTYCEVQCADIEIYYQREIGYSTLEEYITKNQDQILSQIEFARQKGYEIKEFGMGVNYSILFTKDNHLYEISFDHEERSSTTEIERQILSTFNFLDK